VKLENGTLSLVSTSAGAGYTLLPAEVRPDRVKVAFADASGDEARIEVNLVNGQMEPKFEKTGG
jgi:hypothetical protein